MKILFNEPMSAHTTLRIGGRVREFLIPETAEELCGLVTRLEGEGRRWLILGNGSNMLFSDSDLDLAVISTEALTAVTVTGCTVTAEAGASLSKIAVEAKKSGLTGLEFSYGIPGTLGGGVFMNAGAYGGELKDVITGVTVFDGKKMRRMTAAECGFSYRHSAFEDSGAVILSAEMELRPGNIREIRAKMRELMARRAEKQPLEYPSAGSTFKRPAGDYAARLIDEAGLRGLQMGGAQVSEKHTGFLINRGRASYEDFYGLMERVRDEVYKKSGILLEPEVRIIKD